MLSEVQARVREAITSDTTDAGFASLLTGGADAPQRLAIHRRHYEASLVRALLESFPATAWLAGSPLVTPAAQAFVRFAPPTRPCIAEYGGDFPRFLAPRDAGRIPYLHDFAELEWHAGRVALAVDAPALAIEDFAAIDPEGLACSTLMVQDGVRYIDTRWPIDELLHFYLTDSAPEFFSVREAQVPLEVRGARGEFRMTRLRRGEFEFRRRIASGVSLGEAAESASQHDGDFEPGAAFTSIATERLVVAIVASGKRA